MTDCAYCGSGKGRETLVTREMMFGTRQRFDYTVCAGCGSCSLATPLSAFELSDFYPKAYYSLDPAGRKQRRGLAKYLVHQRDLHELGFFNIVGAVLHWMAPGYFDRCRGFALARDKSILDVGCGSVATFLTKLSECGFAHLRGCDPFIAERTAKANIVIERSTVERMTGTFDVVFFNHSFEHLTDPACSLKATRDLQPLGGTCVIRCPTTSSEAFERYKADWVQLDPPRHITVPSRTGIRRLAAACGYELTAMVDESSAFQFWGSERYACDIPLNDDTRRASFQTAAQIRAYARKARVLNKQNRGDQAAFVLRAC